MGARGRRAVFAGATASVLVASGAAAVAAVSAVSAPARGAAVDRARPAATAAPAAADRTATDRADSAAAARRAGPERANTWLREAMSAGDVDWFRYRLSSTTAVSVTLGSLPADYDLTVFDSTGRARGTSTRKGRTFDEAWVRLPAGDVLVRVTRKRGATAGTYALRLRTFSPRVHVVSVRRTDVINNAVGEYYNATGRWCVVSELKVEWLDARGRLVHREWTYTTPNTWLAPWSRLPFLVRGSTTMAQARRVAAVRITATVSTADTPPKLPALTARVTRRGGDDGYYRGTVSTTSRTAVRDVRVYVAEYDPSLGTLMAVGFSESSYTLPGRGSRQWRGEPYGVPPRSPLTVVRAYQD